MKNIKSKIKSAVLFSTALFALQGCANQMDSNQKPNLNNTVEVWLTKADQSVKLQKQLSVGFSEISSQNPTITIQPNTKYQTVDGFGFSLTGGSVETINRLPTAERNNLLRELFSNEEDAIRINYIRLSIGASDLNGDVFSYNDLPAGEVDLELKKFSLEKDRAVINMLKDILKMNPSIKIMATPWSPPVWMKDNGSTIGGALQPKYYDVYAKYFVKYIQEMKKEGIVIDAITPQNEPLHPGNNPSLLMIAEQQNEFVKGFLGPQFVKNGIATKIVLYDHNCNKPEYPISILNDPETRKYVDGSAFHLYEGDISALSKVYNAHPDKNLYFTEQWTGAKGSFDTDLLWHTKNVVIGSMLNWSKTALEWNVANDENFNPHTPGGCTECKGAITIDNSGNIKRNVGYYIIGHASKFVPMNSVRIASTKIQNVDAVAFLTPENKIVVIALNDTDSVQKFNIQVDNKNVELSLDPKSVATYIL